MLEKFKEFFNEYNLKARVYPSLIALVPLFLLFYFVLENNASINAFENVLSSSALTIVVMFIIADIVRNLGKYLETKVFGNELYFPSTEILLNRNSHMSQERHAQIYKKLKGDFNIVLMSRDEETKDEKSARQKIKEAVGLVRQKVGDGRLLLQYNIRYGFWRNLIGVSCFSSLLCAFNLVFIFVLHSNHPIVATTSIILFLFYCLIFIFRRSLLSFFGYQYAEQLLLEYLNK